MSIFEQLAQLKDRVKAEIEQAATVESLDEIRTKVFGRKGGELTMVLRGLGSLASEQRPPVGQQANEVKDYLEGLLAQRVDQLKSQAIEGRLASESLDVTLPGTWQQPGRLHLINRTMRKIKDVFKSLGYSVVQGPEVETDYYNFEALNIPESHPSREMWDSFFLREGLLLRSHTSPMQVRTMEAQEPPVRIIVPGKCYRRDAVDATHFWEFHQVEGLLVDKGVTFADLKGTLELFAQGLFGRRRRAKFNPSYFPFTEPSAEVMVDCFLCEGKGCRVCKNSGWIEIMGCGMVHPRVLAGVNYDVEKYTGFAFGMGVERIAMLSCAVEDIRLLYENDMRFLQQF